MLRNLLSAAVVIGALRVKIYNVIVNMALNLTLCMLGNFHEFLFSVDLFYSENQFSNDTS